jgi:TolA-binding protein
MKTNLIRTMAIVFLATSISAFAQTADAKSEDAATATACNTTQQNVANQDANDPAESNVSLELEDLQTEVDQLMVKDKVNQEEEQNTNQEEQNEVRQQDRQWSHSLLGIYGG